MTDNPKSGGQVRKEKPYDERQKQVRTQCFAHAFFMMPVLLLIDVALRTSIDGVVWFDPNISWICCFELAVVLAMVEADWRDALIPPGEKDGLLWWIIGLVLDLLLICLRWWLLLRNEQVYGIALIQNGYLNFDFLYIFTMAAGAVYAISHLIRLGVLRTQRRNDADEDEEG